MFEELRGKRLLVIAGINLTIEAIRKAQEMGIWVGVLDYNHDTQAKRIADAAFDVSTTDLDAVEKVCRENHIDGVFTNWVDAMLPWGCRICERMGFPYPFTLEQIENYTDKKKFIELCRENGVPVPKEYSLEQCLSNEESIDFPVIVKPVDSTGSRGISVCRDRNQLLMGIEKAKNVSRSGRIQVEQYIDQDEITVNYVMDDGDIMLTSIHDRYFNTDQEGVLKTPDIYIYPSKYTKKYMEDVDPSVRAMLRKSGLKNGSIFMQACVKDGQIYFYETGMRLNGCKIYQLVNAETGYNALERSIVFSLTGSMGKPGIREMINPYLKNWYSTISLLAREGTVGHFEGLDKVTELPGVIAATPWQYPGDVITREMIGTLPQTAVRISLGAETKEQLLERVENVYKTVKLFDVNGENMLLKPHDLQSLSGQLDYQLF